MMKKRIFAVLLIVVLCLSFCSCNYIDEMRKERFDWGNEEKTILISRDGTEYKKVPNEQDKFIEFLDSDYGYIADSDDIPLLLTDVYGEFVDIDPDHNFIAFYADDKGLPSYGTGSKMQFFCRSDRYDAIVDFVDNKDDRKYGYYYYDNMGIKQFRQFTNRELAAVSVTYNVDYIKVPSSEHTYDKSVEIYRYNEEGDLWIRSYDIQLINGKYYVSVYKGSISSVLLYEAPDKEVSTFIKMTKEAFGQ